MSRFFAALWTFTAVAHTAFFLAFWRVLLWLGAPRALATALFATALLITAFRARLALAIHDRPISPLRRFFEEAYYVHWVATFAASAFLLLALVCFVVATVVLAPFNVDVPTGHGMLEVACYALGLLAALWGVCVRPRLVAVRTLEVPIADLPDAFCGYRIAHLSDLHIGSLCPRGRAMRWVRKTRALAPDLVALTGDYITNGTRFHETVADVIGAFEARDGVVATLGNHDFFALGEPMITLLRARGVRVLRNERCTLVRGDDALEIAGIDDTWTKQADVARTFVGWTVGAPLVALAHDPGLFPDLAARGASLVLSGHTHWGQIAVPFFSARYNFARRIFRYAAHVHRLGPSMLHIHPGLGTTGPPVRFGVAPAIVILVLQRA